jgi:hypothetical protein
LAGRDLAALFHHRHVVTDDATADGADHGVMPSIVACNAADGGSGQTAGVGSWGDGDEGGAEGKARGDL